MSTIARARLLQRADYTHKFNSRTGRHGWLRLTPAYSVKIVEELIKQYERPMRVFDPFSGTATTALSAAYHGHEGVTTDINPFLVWFGKTKTAEYTVVDLIDTKHACLLALRMIQKNSVNPALLPPIHNIERWWHPKVLKFLQSLRASIDQVSGPCSSARDLLLVAFCRSLITLSNAAFNHQSMSFKSTEQSAFNFDLDLAEIFRSDVSFVLEGALNNPIGSGKVVLADSRDTRADLGKFDLIITSPPYANRMSYIRELRPYMYWLGFLLSGRDAGELDWQAIGGTWHPTSRLMNWDRPKSHFTNPLLDNALDAISRNENKSGRILANYVAKYFDDIWKHLQSLTSILERNAEIHYIVGNSTFYGTLLPVEKIYVSMLNNLGFAHVECRAIRKRNSKKELIEFDVTGKWQVTKG